MNKSTLTKYLMDLVSMDQSNLSNLATKLKSVNSLEDYLSIIKPVAKLSQDTAEEMLATLKKSGINPTISNIGEDACNAIILIALHSYIEIMQEVRDLFNRLKKLNAKDFPLSYLAVLEDRIAVISTRKQTNGTITYENNGIEYFVPITNIKNLNSRRKKYNLSNYNIENITRKQKAMDEEQYLLNFAFMDRKINI